MTNETKKDRKKKKTNTFKKKVINFGEKYLGWKYDNLDKIGYIITGDQWRKIV